MDRDLHDTLSQGLSGIIMQLYAINANLNKNNIKRAQEIVQKSMEHARKTLSDSRLVMDDLRFQGKSELDFAKAENAVVKIIENHNQISINIADDGIGFDIKLLDKQFGHYGILGITERVKAIHGEI